MLRQHGEERVIPGESLEGELIKALRDYLSVLNALNVKPPIFVFVSLLGVEGYYMAHDKPLFLSDYESYVDKEILLVPEVVKLKATTLNQKKSCGHVLTRFGMRVVI